MIDPPIKAWFKNIKDDEYVEDWLFVIDYRQDSPYQSSNNGRFDQCVLSNPYEE